MNKVLFALMVLLGYLMVGCAAQNTTMAEPAATTMADSGPVYPLVGSPIVDPGAFCEAGSSTDS